MPTLQERFTSKVAISAISECWEWQGSKTSHGHGMIWYKGSNKMAHRIAWILQYGEDPGDQFVIHTCGNNSCVNPKHLCLGDHKLKHQIALKANKGAIANRVPRRSKLSLEQIENIKHLYQNSELTTSEIGKKFGISQQHVTRISRK